MKYDKLFLPVFHSYAHDMACRSKFSPKFMMGLGLEDGENMERLWSQMPYAVHSRYMRPETRRDFITIHAHAIAMKAYLSLPKTIELKLKRSLMNLGLIHSMGGKIKLLKGDFSRLNSISYSVVIENLRNIKNTLQSNPGDDIESEAAMRQYVDLLGLSKIRRDLKGNRRTGTKGAAMEKRTKMSANRTFLEAIEEFNKRFDGTLSDSDVLEALKSDRLERDLEASILCWKSVEQISFCYDDLTSAYFSLNKVSEEMKVICDKSTTDASLVKMLEVRMNLNHVITEKLQRLRSIAIEALDRIQIYSDQIVQYSSQQQQ